MPNFSNINTNIIHSDEVQDIISKSPHWLLRKSMWLTCFLVVTIITCTFFIKYPEILRAPVIITSASPTIDIKPGFSGQISVLNIDNGERVKKGEEIMQIESLIDRADIEAVKTQLDLILNSTFGTKGRSNLKAPEEITLGELLPSYTNLFLQVQAYKMNVDVSVKVDRYEKVLNAVKEIQAEIKEWEDKYIVKSPSSGKIVFNKPLKYGQFINHNDILFSVIPNDYEPVIFSELSGDFFGKINVGDIAFIKLKEYPYREFGMLEVEIKNISELPKNNLYYVEYRLLEGLKTSENFDLPNLLNISAEVDIVLSNNSILYNIFINK